MRPSCWSPFSVNELSYLSWVIQTTLIPAAENEWHAENPRELFFSRFDFFKPFRISTGLTAWKLSHCIFSALHILIGKNTRMENILLFAHKSSKCLRQMFIIQLKISFTFFFFFHMSYLFCATTIFSGIISENSRIYHGAICNAANRVLLRILV